MHPPLLLRALLLAAFLMTPAFAKAESFFLKMRSQKEVAAGAKRYHTITKRAEWDASRTAVIICDMWDDHYCRNSARRVAEMRDAGGEEAASRELEVRPEREEQGGSD